MYCNSIIIYNIVAVYSLLFPCYMDSHTKAKKEELREEKEIQKIDVDKLLI